MRYSIIIPTYNKLEETLKPCLTTLLQFTSLDDTEIIVVANGCTDGTREFMEDLMAQYVNINMLWSDEPLGYTKAINVGLGVAKGEYIVLLNNDTQFQDQQPNTWLEILNKPFREDDTVAVTGPMKTHCPEADRDFIIFFCVMISRRAFDALGLLDEIFSPGYGEDTDFCCRAEDKGWKVVQVPKEERNFYAHNRMTGNFPIYHEGNVTFRNWPGGEELIRKNNEILRNRYNKKSSEFNVLKEWTDRINPLTPELDAYLKQEKFDNRMQVMENDIVDRHIEYPVHTNDYDEWINQNHNGVAGTSGITIERAKQCDGWMSDEELTWLAERATKSKIFIEIGAWHGKSTRAIADNLPQDGVLYAVDHWLGSAYERDTNHASAALEEGDHAFIEFCDNLKDHILSGKVIPIRMASKNAAKFLKDNSIQADTVFVDAGHLYEEVKEDIYLWKPLVKTNGILCGHDYTHDGKGAWPGVEQAVNEVFGQRGTNMGYLPNNSIWAHKIWESNKIVSHLHPNFNHETGLVGFKGVSGVPKSDIYDCFPFNNELDILDRRLAELYDVVDRFVIVEASKTHSGNPKPYHFKDNLARYEKYLNKVTHIMIDDYPEVPDNATVTDKSWSIERHQRECIMRGLTNCKDNDIIIISDADEIPNKKVIADSYTYSYAIIGLEMDLYYYNENTLAKDKWREARITTYSRLKEVGPCAIRYSTPYWTIPNAGKHLSYFGDVDQIIKKIENTAHQEYNKPEFKDPEVIKRLIEEGKDIFQRPNIEFEKL